jgi:multiple sugar transport system permease protein
MTTAPVRGAAPHSPRRGRRATSDRGAATIFLAPFFALFTLCMLAPVVYALVLSVFAEKRSGLGFDEDVETLFVGLENYSAVLTSPSFLEGFGRLGLYVVLYIPTMLGLALVLALLLDSAYARLTRLFQMLLFLPHVVPGVIAALIWTYLYTPGVSPILGALSGAGVELDLFGTTLIVPAVVNIAVWQWTGYNVIIVFTALQAVPRDVLEAASLDGAGGVRIAVGIKLPLVAGSVGVIGLFTAIGALQLFTEPSILAKATTTITPGWVPNMWAYDAAFNRLDQHQAASASLIIALIAGIVSFVITRLTSKGSRS